MHWGVLEQVRKQDGYEYWWCCTTVANDGKLFVLVFTAINWLQSSIGIWRNHPDRILLEDVGYQDPQPIFHVKTVYRTSKVVNIPHEHYVNYVDGML